MVLFPSSNTFTLSMNHKTGQPQLGETLNHGQGFPDSDSEGEG